MKEAITKQGLSTTKKVQVKVYVDAEIATQFKQKCDKNGISMTSLISGFMAEKSQTVTALDALETRRQRRKAVKIITAKLEAIIWKENRYMSNFPENLKNSSVYDTVEQTIDFLEEALNSLNEAY